MKLNRFLNPGSFLAGLLLVLSVSLAFIFLYRKQKGHFTGKEKSIAILSFVNADQASENDYLNSGITSEIFNQLSRISGLRVVMANRFQTEKTSVFTPVQIASRLHVASILTGNIKKTGRDVFIHVDLTDADSGDKIWSRDFESNDGELFSFQNELARVIAEELHMEITREEKSQLGLRPTQNLEAYDQYLKGIYFWNKRDAASLRKGIEFFKQAILLDSNYARAWSGLADCYSALGYGSHDAPSVDFLQAEIAAKKALSIDFSLAEPHTSLGYVHFYYHWDWEKAEQEFQTAIRLNPNYPLAHDAYVYFLTARERYAEANVEMEKAFSLDPASAFIQSDQGFALYYAGYYDRAITILKDVLIRYPTFPLAWNWLGRAYQEKNNYTESLHAFMMARNKDSIWPVALAASGFVYGVSGQKQEAEHTLHQLMAITHYRYVTPYGIALVYTSMKDKNKTFEWLERAYTERTNWLVWLKLDPRWASIKNDPRFISLIQKIGLNQEAVHPRE